MDPLRKSRLKPGTRTARREYSNERLVDDGGYVLWTPAAVAVASAALPTRGGSHIPWFELARDALSLTANTNFAPYNLVVLILGLGAVAFGAIALVYAQSRIKRSPESGSPSKRKPKRLPQKSQLKRVSGKKKPKPSPKKPGPSSTGKKKPKPSPKKPGPKPSKRSPFRGALAARTGHLPAAHRADWYNQWTSRRQSRPDPPP
jgi:hypothetical protein